MKRNLKKSRSSSSLRITCNAAKISISAILNSTGWAIKNFGFLNLLVGKLVAHPVNYIVNTYININTLEMNSHQPVRMCLMNPVNIVYAWHPENLVILDT